MRCKLERQGYPNGPWQLSSSYGQRAEFENALPGMLAPLCDLIHFERRASDLGKNVRREIIIIEKRQADGTVSRERYKLEDMP